MEPPPPEKSPSPEAKEKPKPPRRPPNQASVSSDFAAQLRATSSRREPLQNPGSLAPKSGSPPATPNLSATQHGDWHCPACGFLILRRLTTCSNPQCRSTRPFAGLFRTYSPGPSPPTSAPQTPSIASSAPIVAAFASLGTTLASMPPPPPPPPPPPVAAPEIRQIVVPELFAVASKSAPPRQPAGPPPEWVLNRPEAHGYSEVTAADLRNFAAAPAASEPIVPVPVEVPAEMAIEAVVEARSVVASASALAEEALRATANPSEAPIRDEPEAEPEAVIAAPSTDEASSIPPVPTTTPRPPPDTVDEAPALVTRLDGLREKLSVLKEQRAAAEASLPSTASAEEVAAASSAAPAASAASEPPASFDGATTTAGEVRTDRSPKRQRIRRTRKQQVLKLSGDTEPSSSTNSQVGSSGMSVASDASGFRTRNQG